MAHASGRSSRWLSALQPRPCQQVAVEALTSVLCLPFEDSSGQYSTRLRPWLTYSCSLLSPLGHHRRSFIAPSRGKRAKRRKRKGAEGDVAADAVPPAPELAKYVDLGLASISRSLEEIRAASEADAAAESQPTGGERTSVVPPAEPYAVVFVSRSGQPSAFHSHFPQMVAVASKSVPSRQPIRLVGFSAACEDRLSAALGVPRVSSIGLREGAPQAKALIEFAREHVAPVDVSWFREVESGRFLGTKIKAVEVPIGAKKQRT